MTRQSSVPTRIQNASLYIGSPPPKKPLLAFQPLSFFCFALGVPSPFWDLNICLLIFINHFIDQLTFMGLLEEFMKG